MSKQTYLQDCRNLVSFARNGALSTHSVEKDGYPFGSIMPYDVDANGRLVLYAAKISQHYKNISANPKASVFIPDPFGLHDPHLYGRATVLVDFETVPEEEIPQVRESYSKRFPKTVIEDLMHGFLFLRGIPQSVRWIGGFGDIYWISIDEYQSAEFDEVAYDGMGACAHMNEDHRDALVDFIRHEGSVTPDAPLVQMVSVCSENFDVAVGNSKKRKRVRFPFASKIQSEELRTVIVSMLKEIRADT